jgi:hypothetical protein
VASDEVRVYLVKINQVEQWRARKPFCEPVTRP